MTSHVPLHLLGSFLNPFILPASAHPPAVPCPGGNMVHNSPARLTAAQPRGAAQSPGSCNQHGCSTAVVFPISTSGSGRSLTSLDLPSQYYPSSLCAELPFWAVSGCLFHFLTTFNEATSNRSYLLSPFHICCVD